MNSHRIPNSRDEVGTHNKGRTKDPIKNSLSQVSYRHRLHQTKRSGARASRHPPRWRAQLDNPAKRDEGGGWSVAADQPPFPLL